MNLNLKNRYSEYKNSDIVWLGDIPKHWEIRRVKDLAEYQSGEYINANDFDDTNSYPVFGGNGFRSFADKYNHNGDYILIGRQGALCGNINYVSGKFWATEHAVVVYKKKNVNIKWFGEFLRAMNLNQYALSAAQPGLSVDKVKRLELALPPLNEQNSIASFINHHTAIIDKRVSLLESKISAYKDLAKSVINEAVCKGLDKNVPLKDSGIEWIGKIPKHWQVERFKSFAKTIKGKSTELFDEQLEGSLINLSLDYLRNDTTTFLSYSLCPDKSQRVNEQEYIIIWDGAGVGEILKGKKGVLSSTIAKLKFNPKRMLPNYFYFLRHNLEYTLKSIPTGMGIPHLNPNVLNNYFCPVPPLEEQIVIAEHLEKKTTTIDSILANIKLQIDSLKQLRKTLINDVVTGKLKVTE